MFLPNNTGHTRTYTHTAYNALSRRWWVGKIDEIQIYQNFGRMFAVYRACYRLIPVQWLLRLWPIITYKMQIMLHLWTIHSTQRLNGRGLRGGRDRWHEDIPNKWKLLGENKDFLINSYKIRYNLLVSW